MRQRRVLSVFGLSVWSAVCSASQTPAPAPLSPSVRAHVKEDRFDTVTSIRGLPLGVRDELQKLFGAQALDIAEPGGEFQSTGTTTNRKLPMRRLLAAGCSQDHCLVYYERGGDTHTWVVALFHWMPAETRLEWGGHARSGLHTIDDVRSAVLSGEIKGPVTDTDW